MRYDASRVGVSLHPPAAARSLIGYPFRSVAHFRRGLLDRMKKSEEWQTDEAGCREKIQTMAEGIARVIVPLCLSLPKNLPKVKERIRPRSSSVPSSSTS